MTNMGFYELYVGLIFIYLEDGILLVQKKLCLEAVVKIWYVECHFATTPINERSRLQVDMNFGLMDVTYYQ